MIKESKIQIIIQNNKYGFADLKGNILLEPVYDYAAPFSEGLALVCVDGHLGYGKCGFINLDMKEVINCQYSCARSFSEGLAQVEMKIEDERLNGYINSDGKMIIQPCFNFAKSFQNGIAQVCIGKTWVNGKFGAINKQGEAVVPIIYDEIDMEGNYLMVKKEKKWGLMNLQGEIIIPLIYEKILAIGENVCQLQLNKEIITIKLPV